MLQYVIERLDYDSYIGAPDRNYRGKTDLAYKDENGEDKYPYSRIISRKKAGVNNGSRRNGRLQGS